MVFLISVSTDIYLLHYRKILKYYDTTELVSTNLAKNSG